jgi:hypothetical protein
VIATACGRGEGDGHVTTLIKGRVLDAEARGIAGARVVVDYSFSSEPASGNVGGCDGQEPSVALTGPAGEYAFTSEAHPELQERLRGIEDHKRVFEGRNPNDLAARATLEQRASQRVVFDWDGECVTMPDLVLGPGLVARVRARWTDNAPAAAVPMEVMLQQGDTRADLLSFQGVTDMRGELTFGPVPDREYRIVVRASHPTEPPYSDWWESRALRKVIEVTLPRGSKIRGRVLTARGEPAAGYRVAPSGQSTGDPENARVVETDADGRFELAGMDPRGGAIAVYDRLPSRPREGERPTPEEIMMLGLRAVNPLLICHVADDETDVGTLTLPEIGAFAVRLEDARGGRPLSGSSFWWHANGRHGSHGFRADADGIVRFERLPLGTPLTLQVTVEDSEQGELEQRFGVVAAKDETLTLKVTGAGTVVLRLHRAGAPDEPLKVRDSWAQFHQYHGLAHEGGWTSELRGWVAPGVYPALRITARDYRERVIEGLRVRDDGPTFVDVELEPQ